MPLSQTQAQDTYIINSFAQFLNRNVKAWYDTQAALTSTLPESYDSPLKILMGSPDDPEVGLYVPSIAIDFKESSNKGEDYGLGDATMWRPAVFTLYCYPSQDKDQRPSRGAEFLMTSAVKNGLGGVSVRIIDYANPDNSSTNILYLYDVMFLERVTTPMPRSGTTSNGLLRHRFDVTVTVKYPVVESLAN
jgi:hypothetical protein